MTVVYPDGVRSRGNESVIFVATIADKLAPKLTELNATTSVVLSCWLSGFGVNGSQATATDARLCSDLIFEDAGDITMSIDNLEYVYSPQATAPVPDNKAYEVLKKDVTGFLVDRRGLNAKTSALAIGQKVDVYPVRMGEQFRMPVDPGAQGGKFRISQNAFVIAGYAFDSALVA